MAYRLSKRREQIRQRKPNNNIASSKGGIDLGKVAIVFILYGILSLITAWMFSMETERIFSDTIYPSIMAETTDDKEEEGRDIATVGPITVIKRGEVYSVNIASGLPANTWAFVEGEVLDAEKEYLFSFGKELWHETGYDDEGGWDEADGSYTMKITFPEPGQYYLHLKIESNYGQTPLKVTISQSRGSSIPHMVFGIFTLLIGVVLNEIYNKTLSHMIKRGASYDY